MAELLTLARETAVEVTSPTTDEDGASPVRLVVRLIGDTAGRTVTAYGESTLRDQTLQEENSTWQFVTEALQRIHGARLRHAVKGDGAAHQIRRMMAELEPVATRETAATSARRAMLGIEMAVLDLVAQCGGVGVAQLLAPDHAADRAPALPDVVLDRSPTELVDKLRELPLGAPVAINLGRQGSAAVEHLLGLCRQVPLLTSFRWWLYDLGGAGSGDVTTPLTLLARAMRRGRAARWAVLVPEVEMGPDEVGLLQGNLDRMLRGRLLPRPRADLRVAAAAAADAVDKLSALVGEGVCRAIQLNVTKIGSLLEVFELAKSLTASRPDLAVAYTAEQGSGELTSLALQHLATSLPEVDAAAFVGKPSVAPTLAEETELLTRPGGLGADVSLAAITARTRRYYDGPASQAPMLHGVTANMYPEEDHTRWMGKSAMRSHLVEREALAHGLSVTRYTEAVFAAHDRHERQLVFSSRARSHASEASSFMISDRHKGAAHSLLTRAGIPVPETRVFDSADVSGAVSFARSIGYPVVAKPASGTGGAGVFTNLSDDEQVLAAFEGIRAEPGHSHDDILVQRHLTGESYRIMVDRDEVFGAAARLPASVTGDGARSIAELIIQKNAYRRTNPRLRKGFIDRDTAVNHLRQIGLTLDYIPHLNERVMLSDAAYMQLGADWIEVLDELHPTIATTAIEAVAAIPGMRFCGIDILLEDHRVPIADQSGGICELNSSPELISPQFPLFGPPRHAARRVLKLAAERRGLALATNPAEEIAVTMTVTGSHLGDHYVAWLRQRAGTVGLTCQVEQARDDVVSAAYQGPVIPVTSLSSVAVLGPPGSAPESVTTRPAADQSSDKRSHGGIAVTGNGATTREGAG
jgi:D-alanine-D-alanine ligase-like ATP-grasp enzyme/L-alanine-DL-glutamate epimerase-like enolase superfamily enzyme